MINNSSQNRYAKETGSHQFRNVFQRFKRMMYTKTMIKKPDQIITSILTKRTNKGIFQNGSLNYSRSYAIRRKKAGLTGGRIKLRIRKKAYSPNIKNRKKPFTTKYIFSSDIRRYSVQPATIRSIKEKYINNNGEILSRKRNGVSWKDIVSIQSKRGLNPFFLNGSEQSEVISQYMNYLNQRSRKIFNQDVFRKA